MQKIQAKIHLGNIRRNAERFKALSGKKLCAVVKADAYGHGAAETVSALSGVADFFAVALIDEAKALRTAVCGKDILIFTPPINEEETLTIAQDDLIATVPDLWTANLVARACQKYGVRLRVHLKVNTGMNRYGMGISELGKVCKRLKACKAVEVEGAYTHLYECSRVRAREQNARFEKAQAVCNRYFSDLTYHLGGTFAAITEEKLSCNALRIGIGLYGYLPCPCKRIRLEKAMEVFAQVIAVRKPSYGGLGYGKAVKKQRLQKAGRIFVLRCGYADGFLRIRRNGADGAEKNVNTLCMDVGLRKGRPQRGAWLPVMTDADATAKKTGTISYEVLCAVTRRAERIYDDE